MHDRHIESSLLWLAAVSLLLHIVAFSALYFLPAKTKPPPTETQYVDLRDIQLPEEVQKETPPARKQSEFKRRVKKETAPKSESGEREVREIPRQPSQQQTAQPRQLQQGSRQGISVPAPDMPSREGVVPPGSSASGLLKPRAAQQPSLAPSYSRLAKMEEMYRKRYADDIAEGNTALMDTDDTAFYSFLRRFENAVYGVWRYPMEAQVKGIKGTTPVRITFRRDGTIDFDKTRLLESSGHRILDEEVLRTLRSIGPLGSFPKGYSRDEFHLIAFFHYGGTRRSLR